LQEASGLTNVAGIFAAEMETDMYRYVLFDLDGTLTDPKEGITKCVQYALEKNGITPPPMEELMCFIGPPLVHSFMEFYGMDREQAEKATADYRERFRPVGIFENDVYEGINDMLSALKEKGYKIALATSKPTEFAKKILEYFEMDVYFDVVFGSEFNGVRETKTEVMEDVLSELYKKHKGSEEEFRARCIMVGDRKHDIIGAKNCGIHSIGVEYGYAPEGELEAEGATYIVDTVDELAEFLLKNFAAE